MAKKHKEIQEGSDGVVGGNPEEGLTPNQIESLIRAAEARLRLLLGKASLGPRGPGKKKGEEGEN
jgi:hypothetical protein